jgi:hypothetical protein
MHPAALCALHTMHVQDACISASANESGAAAQALARLDRLQASMPFSVASPLTKPFTVNAKQGRNDTLGGVLPSHA